MQLDFRCYLDHSIFVWCSPSGTTVLTIYVDDILLTDSFIGRIKKTKMYFKQQYVTKDMKKLSYF